MQNSSEGDGIAILPLARDCVFPSPRRRPLHTPYSVTGGGGGGGGKALRPLPQSAGEGWDGVQTGDIDNTWTGHMGNTLQSLAGATLNVAEVPYHRSTL